MEEHAAIEKDQYEKIHALTSSVDQLRGAVDVANQINIELMKLLKKALCYEFWVIVLMIGAIIYGAIGKEGFYAVRSLKNPVAFDAQIAPPPDNRFTITNNNPTKG